MRHASAPAPTIDRPTYPRATAGSDAFRPAAPWIERLARVGFAAKAVLYIVVGVLALRAAFGNGGETTGSQGALQALVRQPLGALALVVIAAGLFGYAAWRVVEAIMDPEQRGNGPKGIALRFSFVGRGVFHAALGVQAVRLATGSTGSNGAGAEAWTARVLDAPMGSWLVMASGLGIVGYGLYQLYRAWIAKLSRQLDLSSLTSDASSWVV